MDDPDFAIPYFLIQCLGNPVRIPLRISLSNPAREARRGFFVVFGVQKQQKHRELKQSGARSAPGEFWGVWDPEHAET